MLILTRKSNETITIGNNIKVTICSIKGDRVRIGIDAPKGVAVHRQEIFDKVKNSDLPLKRVSYELPPIKTRYQAAVQDCAARSIASLSNPNERGRFLYNFGGLVIKIDARNWIDPDVLKDCLDEEWRDIYDDHGLTIYGYIVAAEIVAPRIEDLLEEEVSALERRAEKGDENAAFRLSVFNCFKKMKLERLNLKG